ncbi:preprotein translocase subunit SecA [candidate division WOR-3 bacterium JGI_Cruoil_03_44_89]|uniref:Protein translocase subunit SecA n=1 Tax=candidate division WOR-3 bacterium JGI_Cruoil_03_44_89 TaxID=1973748 RepID=A0A235BMF8_UNCW3|nr:MAG: preprotein translocase subunit SecA [candidate division WOR-3 bacterium JGI_Cruoil_03_44_89]
MKNPLTKIFGTANDKELARLKPIVEEINQRCEGLHSLTDEELRNKTEEFRTKVRERLGRIEEEIEELERRRDGEDMETRERLAVEIDNLNERLKREGRAVLDGLLPEVYAVVKEACRRLLGKKWMVTGREYTWDMVPFDVQLIGAIVLHEGKIAEMATGEGKTLVATMPLYLNSLSGKGAHLVTVNDYLARRDAEWMGGVYEFLGVSCGCIQTGMTPEERKKEYGEDITYGTNNEFGFDYLRDNMAWMSENIVQRGHHYAIVDEVDSVLIDEARTPLIISGLVEHSVNREYEALNPRVRKAVQRQTALVNSFVADAKKFLADGKEKEAGVKLLAAERGAPKHRQLRKLIEEEPRIKRLIEQTEAEFMRDKKLHEVDELLYYSIDERAHTVNVSEDGRDIIAPDDAEFFTLPDLSQVLVKIERNETLSSREKMVEKDAIQKEYAGKSQRVHAINQLLRAYSLFEKDVEYVIQNGKVIIVDEFTGRLMPGRRYSDGLHQAIEAKEGAKIEAETQTFATITIQNYFRMYEKLAGMTGTAATEAHEFYDIYKLDVITIPTNKPVRRVNHTDVIYKTKREKYTAVIDEIVSLHKQGRPVLVGTVSVDVSEKLSRMLRMRGIPHQVLNAKHHQKEAEIIAHAGEMGKVTISTSMAGRGTDIKLDPGVVKCKKCCIKCEEDDSCAECGGEEKSSDCLKNPPCGLHIIGTGRHEARRIDNQLRGRSARQGDPGSSRFYLSLEDDLMRLFGSDRIAGVMERFGAKEGEPIQHNLITRAIEGAQKRIERMNFDIRKRLLEYDDVMNRQRKVIYSMRQEILAGKDIKPRIEEIVESVLLNIIDMHTTDSHIDAEGFTGLREEIRDLFLLDIQMPEDGIPLEELRERMKGAVFGLYKKREEELGEERMRDLERQVIMQVIDRGWREHLYELDALKEGVSLRGYAQRDPLVEYKRESFELFEEVLDNIDRDTVRYLYGLRLVKREETERTTAYKPGVAATAQAASGSSQGEGTQQKPKTYKRDGRKVGRNDPCPCGSGKKYKNCCWPKYGA